MTLRVMIADDEALARARLRRLVSLEPDVEVVAEAASTTEALREVAASRPDILLLDIRMPGGEGFDVLDALPTPPPAVVFVTAYADHAVRAFEVEAVDYLLKPFDKERFRLAFARARSRLQHRDALPSGSVLRGLLDRADTVVAGRDARVPDRLLVRSGQRMAFVPVESIDWIEGAGNYARLHTGDGTHLLRGSLADLEERLRPRGFLRIHRSTIVNAARVIGMRHWSGGTHVVELEDGTELRVTAAYREALLGLYE